MENYFAVIFRKIKMDDLGLFVYKPFDVALGTLIEENGKRFFVAEDGNKYLFNNDVDIMNNKVRYVVGNALPKAYMDALFQGQFDDEQIKDYLYQDALGRLNFGMYVKDFDKIELSAVNLNEAYTQMYIANLMEQKPEVYQEMVREEERKYLKNKIGFNNFGKQDLYDPFKQRNTIGFINEPRLSEEEEMKKPKSKVKIGFQLPNDQR